MSTSTPEIMEVDETKSHLSYASSKLTRASVLWVNASLCRFQNISWLWWLHLL